MYIYATLFLANIISYNSITLCVSSTKFDHYSLKLLLLNIPNIILR